MTQPLKDKVVLVTGASRGIGRAIAETFAAAGARVAVLARDAAAVEEVTSSCRARGAKAFAVAADVTDEEAVRRAVAAVGDTLGSVDILVNNAGVGRYGPADELTGKDWDETLAVNVKGVAMAAKAVIPGMKAARRGHIINISSVLASTFRETFSAYSASKAAVNAYSETLAKELTPFGIRVSIVSPGGTLTDFGGVAREEKNPAYLEPQDVADVVLAVATYTGRGMIRQTVLAPAV